MSKARHLVLQYLIDTLKHFIKKTQDTNYREWNDEDEYPNKFNLGIYLLYDVCDGLDHYDFSVSFYKNGYRFESVLTSRFIDELVVKYSIESSDQFLTDNGFYEILDVQLEKEELETIISKTNTTTKQETL